MTFDDIWAQYESVRHDLNERIPREGPVAQLDEEVQELNRQLRKLQQIVLGHPGSFDVVRCWMIDAVGTQAECKVSKELVQAIEEDAEQGLGHQYISRFGALPSEVRLTMACWNLTDSGGGCDSWHLGCHCTELEARELCTELHKRFSHTIDAGILAIERKAWSLRLKSSPAF